MIQVGDSFPPVHVDGVSFAAFEHAVNGSTSNSVHKVSLVGEGMGVTALIERSLLGADLILGVVHEHRARDIGEARVETTSDQNISICQSNCYRVRLKAEIVRNLFARPEVSCEIVLENQILIVRVSKEVALGNWLVLMIEELECVLVRELNHWVLERTNLFKHLVCNLRVEAHCAMLELVEWGIESLVYADEILFKSFEFALVLQLGFLQCCDFVSQLV